MNRRIFFKWLGIGLAAFLTKCGKAQAVLGPPVEPGDSEKDINVKPGMNLVGFIGDELTGEPLPSVKVSDGYSITHTDAQGVYQLKRNDKAVFVYFSIPADREVAISGGTPLFYDKIDHSKSVYRKDFKLAKLKGGAEDKFTLFCFADPQVRNNNHVLRFEKEHIPDVRAEVAKHANAYGVVLGDIVHDVPSLLPVMKRGFGNLNVKTFPVIGNHDCYEGADNDYDSKNNYENTFGPTNYSFERGKVHFVVIDNVRYSGRQKYTGGFTQEQMTWLEQDLKNVPKNKMLIVCLHIPTRGNSNYQIFYSLLSQFNEVHIMAGHTHYNQNIKIPEWNIYEHVHGAVCGNWWSSNINGDGAPNGYAIYEIEGNNFKDWHYKGTNEERDYQLRMYPVGSFLDPSNVIIANVWNADEDWKIELFEDGVKTGDMERFTDYEKSVYQFFLQTMQKPEPSSGTSTTSWYRRPDHLYRLKPKFPESEVMVKATDRFGNVYMQNEFSTDFKGM